MGIIVCEGDTGGANRASLPVMVRSFCLILPLLLLPSCAADPPAPPPRSAGTTAEPATATVSTTTAHEPVAAAPDRTPAEVVEELGRRMKLVSTLAPPDVVARDIRTNYGELVAPALLDQWLADPATAPGRQVSSPWPDRIVVTEPPAASTGTVTLAGHVVEATSSGESGRIPIRVTLEQREGHWRITRYETTMSDPDNPETAVAVIVDYYRAIAAHDYERAYRLWGTGGPPGQTLESFTKGFADTASVTVAAGTPSRIDAAAGSRYIDIPVTVTAKTTAGQTQRFTGTYILRRSVVDGATPSQRAWHLYRASLKAAPRRPSKVRTE